MEAVATKYKKVKSIADIKADPRIADFTRNYDGAGVHMAQCKDGYYFEDRCTIAIGSVAQICGDINDYLMTVEDYENLYHS